MKKQPGMVNVSVQIDERIIERFKKLRGWSTLARFIRVSVVRRIVELERSEIDPWDQRCADDKALEAFFTGKEINEPRRPRRRLQVRGTLRAYILSISGGVCHYCRCPLGAQPHVDHVHPASKGGGNVPENLVASCVTCNVSKGARPAPPTPRTARPRTGKAVRATGKTSRGAA